MAVPIDPRELYSFAAAARLIPSCRGSKRLHVATLHSWRERGLIHAEPRHICGKTWWFIWGSEIIRIIGTPPEVAKEVVTTYEGRSTTQRERAQREAEAYLATIYGRRKEKEKESTP